MFDVEAGNVKTAVDTLQQAAQQEVDDLSGQITSLGSSLVTANQELAADAQEIADLKAQLAAQQPVVYRGLERTPWHSNTAASVGGSGLGTGGWKAPGIECAEFWIAPTPGVAKPNYVDSYNTQRVTTDGTKTHFKLEKFYMFPTAADVAACQCIEWEERQVTDDQKMVIIAGQAQYSGGQLRYFDWQQRAWLSMGVPITRPAPLTWVNVGVEGHRDATTVYYDAMTYNGVRYPMTQKYPLLATTWSPLLWAAIQLDDSGAANPYRIKVDAVDFTVWA